MKIYTHQLVDRRLVGRPINVKNDEAEAKLKALPEMVVDELGLVHGGFTFGLADYVAMIAVNHPYVVLARSDVRFLRPVKVGDEMVAYARVVKKEGPKRSVEVSVMVDGIKVLEGNFSCTILDDHILCK